MPRPRTRPSWRTAAGTTAALALTLAACGSAPPTAPAAPPAPATTVATQNSSPPATTTPTPTYGRSSEYQFTTTDSDGYRQRVDFRLEAPVAVRHAIPGQIPAGAPCQPDPQRDLVVPFTIKLTSLTTGFDIKAEYRFKPVTLDNDRLVGYLDIPGGTCVPRFGLVSYEGPALSLTSSVPLKPGGYTQASGFVLYRDFFTPAGNKTAELAGVFLDLGGQDDKGTGGLIDMTANSGVVCTATLSHGATGSHYIAPLDGVSTGTKTSYGRGPATCGSSSSSTTPTTTVSLQPPSGPVTTGNIPR